jgi:hypothetical protein
MSPETWSENKKRILIVDDEEDIVELLCDITWSGRDIKLFLL